jgi:uncharacterized membrane protein
MRLLLFFLFLGFILLVSNGLISCKDTQTNPSLEIVFPNDSVSFTKHVQPLFQQRCTGSPCHGSSAQNISGLNLEYPYAYTNIMTLGLVVPGDAIHSVLYQKIEGSSPLMPPSKSTQLTQNQISGIKTWINEGARYP